MRTAAARALRGLCLTAGTALLLASCSPAQDGPRGAGATATATVSPSPVASPTAVAALPLPFETGIATQAITVVAPSADSTTATLQTWHKTPAGWLRRGPAIPAYVGRQGMTTRPSENLAATPVGSFTLTEAFGLVANPGTRLPYFTADRNDYWVADAGSRHYNTHYRCARNCPFDPGAGENLYRVGEIYTYAVVMDYNRFPVRAGAGSAFFLHVTENKPTTGCISIPKPDLVSIMRWIDPAAHPRILVGVAA